MLTVNMFDRGCAHMFNGQYMDPYQTPSKRINEKIKWIKHPTKNQGLEKWEGITVVVDSWILEVGEDFSRSNLISRVDTKHKIGILIEPMYTQASELEHNVYIKNFDAIKNHYDFILTWNSYLLKKYPDHTRLCPAAYTWVKKENIGVHKKTKNVSMIYSYKQAYEGHLIRHSVAEHYQKKYDSWFDDIRHDSVKHTGISMQFPEIDLYGTGQKNRDGSINWQKSPYSKPNQFLHDKEDALKDYRFSVVIENVNIDNGFTEKFIDCLLTGTVPIYWGVENIGDFFDIRGIVQVKSKEDIVNAIDNLTEEDYVRMLPYVKLNFQEAMKYEYFENSVYENIKHLI